MASNTRIQLLPLYICISLSACSAATSAASGRLVPTDLPLHFEANVGQTDSAVAYLARGRGYTLFLTRTETVLAFAAPRGDSPVAVRLQWLGTSTATRMSGSGPLTTITRYITGGDRSLWSKNVPNYERVRYTGLYPGIDALYYAKEGRLEYDLVLAPGADPARAEFEVAGASGLRVDAGGNLVIHLADGDLYQHHPVVYQDDDGKRREVASRYVLRGGNRVGFAVGAYNRGRELVIDPVLTYSTYLGGASEDKGTAVAVDSAGNAYVTGTTSSQSFPGTKGQPAAISYGFVAKLTPAGDQIPFAYYIGGNTGYTQGQGIAVSGNFVYLTGQTSSADFPTTNPIKSAVTGSTDAYVMKISTDGSKMVYSTLLGGSNGEFGYGIAADADGNAYICGMTQSTDFPTTNGAQRTYGGGIADSFVAKLDAAGNLAFGSYIGGSGDDRAEAIALDSSRNVYVAGYTSSSNFPKAPYQNLGAFAVKLSADGANFLYSLVFGAQSRAQGIAVDAAGAAYIVGYTPKQNGWPSQPGGFQTSYGGGSYDAFVSKINSAGNALVYSTYLGGSGDETAYAVTVDGAGDAYVVGETTSPNFPAAGGVQSQLAGARNAFLTVFNPGGSALAYSTFLGGSGADSATGVALIASGAAVLTGYTNSLNFPTANALQPKLGGSNNAYNDAFVTRIDFANSGSACTYSLDKTSLNAVAAGGSASIQVTAPSGCAWTADASAIPWVSFTSTTSGSGNGSVDLLIAANTSTSSRTGTMTVAGTNVTVTQGGASSTSLAKVLSVGDPAFVNLPPVNTYTLFNNYYSFRVDVPQNSTRLVIDLTAAQRVDLDLAVKFGADVSVGNGSVLADYFTNGSGGVKRLVITPSSGTTIQAGSYYIAFLQHSTGQEVTATIAASVANTGMSSATTISTGSTVTGVLTTSSGQSAFYGGYYADTYRLTLTQPTTISLTMSSTDFHPYVLVYDSNGVEIGEMGPYATADALVMCPLAAGSYWIEASTEEGKAVGSYSLQVSQIQQSTLSISNAGVTNSASFVSGGVAPGEIVTVFGTNLGPSQPASMQVQNGKATTTLAGVRVLVNDMPAPMISAMASQVSFAMPYGVEMTDWVEIQVEYQGSRSNYAMVPVVNAFPGLYQDSSGQAAALNEDYSVNSASNPVQAGHYITLYGTGHGETKPIGIDGAITGSTLEYPYQIVTVQIGGESAEVAYAGSAPGQVEGVLQINAKIPADTQAGSKVPVTVTIGGITCSATIAVK